MAYEKGMKWEMNDITNQVTIYFRGRKTKLPADYNDYNRAKEAAEKYCRKNGWQG